MSQVIIIIKIERREGGREGGRGERETGRSSRAPLLMRYSPSSAYPYAKQ
jgi:hypothetical protein